MEKGVGVIKNGTARMLEVSVEIGSAISERNDVAS